MAALSAEVEATIMGATLEIEGEALTPIRCYKLAGERLALYGLSGAVDGLTADCDTVVAVVCTTSDGRTVETLVDSASGSQFLLEDPIMCTYAGGSGRAAVIPPPRKIHLLDSGRRGF